MIVAIGVVLAIEVSSRNEERPAKRTERVLIQRLLKEAQFTSGF